MLILSLTSVSHSIGLQVQTGVSITLLEAQVKNYKFELDIQKFPVKIHLGGGIFSWVIPSGFSPSSGTKGYFI